MFDRLLEIDRNLFVFLNGKSPSFLDGFMRLMSETWIWFPVVGTIIFIMLRKDLRQGLLYTLVLFLTLVLTEQISVEVFKEGFQRLRPCHEPDLHSQIRLIADQCGGEFGFVSTHASNAFGIIIFSGLAIKNRLFLIIGITWAVLVSYSRIHLGVHYPGDVLGGTILGLAIGFFTFAISKILLKSIQPHEQKS